MAKIILILIACTLLVIPVSVVKGLMPFVRYYKELKKQKEEFRRFMEVIRIISGRKDQGDILRKVACDDDNMFRVVKQHVFYYCGGIGAYDERISEWGGKLPCEVVVYCDEKKLFIINKGIIESSDDITGQLLENNSAAVELNDILTIEKTSADRPSARIVYAGEDGNKSFVLQNYIWQEIFLDEQVDVVENEADIFLSKILSKKQSDISDCEKVGHLGEYTGFMEVIFDRNKRKTDTAI